MGMALIITLLILVSVGGGGLWLFKVSKTKDEDVLTATPEQKKGVGKGLALFKPDRIESEVKLDAAVVQLPRHVVVKTWIGNSFGHDEYRWKCSCGVSGSSMAQWLSRERATEHVQDGNKAEELKAKTDGRFSW